MGAGTKTNASDHAAQLKGQAAMPNPQVIVTIGPDGKSVVETANVQGPRCESLSAGIEAALGARQSNDRKPEFHQQAKAVQPAAAQQGAG